MADEKWIVVCKRTEDPKLGWIERRLDDLNIPHRRNGSSFHAPILEIQEKDEAEFWRILSPIDHLPDDMPVWTLK